MQKNVSEVMNRKAAEENAEYLRGYRVAESENPSIDAMTNADLFTAALQAQYGCDRLFDRYEPSLKEKYFSLGIVGFFDDCIEKRGLTDDFKAFCYACKEWDKAVLLRIPNADSLSDVILATIPKDNPSKTAHK